MRLTSGYENRRARIEMLPLMDVVFLLLVFFIYAMISIKSHHGMPVVLPSTTGNEGVSSYPMVITLTKESKIMVGDEERSIDSAVRSALAETAAGSRRVFIRGDRNADLGIALELLSELRAAGVDAVSFLTKKKVPPGSEPSDETTP